MSSQLLVRKLSDGFRGKVAVVTGAASGLGRGTAEALAQDGAGVVLFDRDAAGLNDAAASCPGSIVVVGDVTIAADVARAVGAAASLGPLALVATAAGTALPVDGGRLA